MIGGASAALTGGALIGLSATILLVSIGRVAGISSIVGGLMEGRRDGLGWRVAFVAGLLAGAVLVAWMIPGSIVPRPATLSPVGVAIAGLLVGFGTQLGSGCTSGHGVCGLSRLSKRSLVAVLSFMSAAALTTFVLRHVLGGAS